MSGPLDEALATAVRLFAERTGVAFEVEDLAAIAQRAATLLAGLVDDAAKQRATAAGDNAAAAITAEDKAEAELRKP